MQSEVDILLINLMFPLEMAVLFGLQISNALILGTYLFFLCIFMCLELFTFSFRNEKLSKKERG